MSSGRPERFSRRALLARGSALFAALHAPLLRQTSLAEASAELRFRHIELESQDPEELATFYGDVLGLPARMISDACEITAGESILAFQKARNGRKPFYHFAFNIPENKLDHAMAWAEPRFPLLHHRKSGGPVVHFRAWNAHAVYFLDPAGNVVEFIARHTLQNARPGSFSTNDILNVSEIGLVTPDVPALEERIQRELGIEVYKRSSPVFAPIGGEHALFILAKEGRVWLPTDDVKAEPHAASVTADGIHGSLNADDQPFSVKSA